MRIRKSTLKKIISEAMDYSSAMKSVDDILDAVRASGQISYDQTDALLEPKAYPNHRVIHAGPLFFGKDQVPENKAAQWERQAEVLGDLVQQVGIDLAGASSIDAVAAKGAYPALVARSKLQMTAASKQIGQSC